MARIRNANSYLREGTEVVTDDLRVGHIFSYNSLNTYNVRFHTPPWPFGEIKTYKRCQLREVVVELEAAPF